jgi:uncharacterized protein (TIGR00255 family)
MLTSMTGYGRARLANHRFAQTWEVKGVNSRFLDLKWRLPHFARSMENTLERVVREKIHRGRVEISLHFEALGAEFAEAQLNEPLVLGMIAKLNDLAVKCHAPFTPDLNRLLNVPAAWRDPLSEPDPDLNEQLAAGLREALDDFKKSRQREGEMLAKDLLARVTTMEALLEKLKEQTPPIKEKKTAALTNRITELVGGQLGDLPKDRILQEAAILCDKLDVSEELTRLGGHLERLKKVVNTGGETGKRLDFLLQEAFREINTLGNKAQDLTASELSVEFKAELEKCREQVQNVE